MRWINSVAYTWIWHFDVESVSNKNCSSGEVTMNESVVSQERLQINTITNQLNTISRSPFPRQPAVALPLGQLTFVCGRVFYWYSWSDECTTLALVRPSDWGGSCLDDHEGQTLVGGMLDPPVWSHPPSTQHSSGIQPAKSSTVRRQKMKVLNDCSMIKLSLKQLSWLPPYVYEIAIPL